MVEWVGIVSWVASMRYCVRVNGILFVRPLSSSSFLEVVPAVRRGFIPASMMWGEFRAYRASWGAGRFCSQLVACNPSRVLLFS